MNWNTTSAADRQHFDPAEVFAAGLTEHHLANTAYPIGHVTTMRPYRVTRRDAEDRSSGGTSVGWDRSTGLVRARALLRKTLLVLRIHRRRSAKRINQQKTPTLIC